MTGKSAQNSCWSCGETVPGEPCHRCGCSTLPPQPVPIGRVGLLVYTGRKNKADELLIVSDLADEVRAIDRHGGVQVLAPTELSKTGVPHRENAHSPAGVLAIAAANEEVTASGFSSQALLSEARDWVGDDLARNRLLAIDLVRTRQSDQVELLNLGEDERAWILGLAALSQGDLDRGVSHLLSLPPERRPERAELLLSFRGEIRSNDDLREATLAWAISQKDSLPAAAALAFSLAPARNQVNEQLIETLAALHSSDAALEVLDLISRMQSGRSLRSCAQVAPTAPAWSSLKGSSRGRVELASTARLPEPLLDDLIDNRRLAADDPDAIRSLFGDRAQYVIARLDPSLLDDEEVEQLDLQVEAIRRAVVQGDRDTVLRSNSDLPELKVLLDVEKALGGDHEARQRALSTLPESRRGTFLSALDFGLEGADWPSPELVADRTLWPWLAGSLAGVVPALDQELNPDDKELLAWLQLIRSRNALYSWQWEEAVSQGKAALSYSPAESIRDEVLNVIAFSHLMQGRAKEGAKALKSAISGQYTMGLLVNSCVVAAEADPTDSSTALARIIAEAPTLSMRTSAVRQALALWDRAFIGASQFSPQSMPFQLRSATRALLVDDLDLPTFRELALALARLDTTWMSRDAALAASPHAGSWEAKVAVALAQGPDPLVDALQGAMRARGTEEWLDSLARGLTQSVINDLLQDQVQAGASNLGLKLIDTKIPMDRGDRLAVTLLSIRELTFIIEPGESHLKEERFNQAINAVRELRSSGDIDLVNRLNPLAEATLERLSIHYSIAATYAVDQAVQDLYAGRNHAMWTNTAATMLTKYLIPILKCSRSGASYSQR